MHIRGNKTQQHRYGPSKRSMPDKNNVRPAMRSTLAVDKPMEFGCRDVLDANAPTASPADKSLLCACKTVNNQICEYSDNPSKMAGDIVDNNVNSPRACAAMQPCVGMPYRSVKQDRTNPTTDI